MKRARERLGRFLDSAEKRALFSNFGALFVLQMLNYILPLINMPYIIRKVGLEKFGVLAFAGAIVIYLTNFVGFGFNYTATQEIATHRGDAKKVNEIFSSVLTIKFLLLLAALCLLLVLLACFERMRREWLVYLFTFGLVVSDVVFPVWFFQGFERMGFITGLNAVSKLFFTLCVFLFIRGEADYALSPLLTSLGGLLAGGLALAIVRREFGVRFSPQPVATLRKYFVSSLPIFLSNFSALTYRNLNSVILGALTSDAVVGSYAVAEKITYAAQQLQTPVGNALFPYLSRKIHESRAYFFSFTRRWFKYLGLGYGAYALAVFAFAPLLIQFFTGGRNGAVIVNLRILSVVVLLGGLNYYLGILGLVTLGLKREFSRSMLTTALFSVVCCVVLVILLGDHGAAMTMVLSEGLLFIYLTVIINKYKKQHD